MYTLPKADQELLDTLGYKQKLEEVDKAILVNADFLAQIVSEPEIFGHDLEEEEGEKGESNADPSNFTHSHESGASFVLFRTTHFLISE